MPLTLTIWRGSGLSFKESLGWVGVKTYGGGIFGGREGVDRENNATREIKI